MPIYIPAGFKVPTFGLSGSLPTWQGPAPDSINWAVQNCNWQPNSAGTQFSTLSTPDAFLVAANGADIHRIGVHANNPSWTDYEPDGANDGRDRSEISSNLSSFAVNTTIYMSGSFLIERPNHSGFVQNQGGFVNNGAQGYWTFSSNPTNGQTIVINGVTWTFVTSGASGTQTNIGANLAATLTQLAIDVNASANGSIDVATYSATSTRFQVLYIDNGSLGQFTLAIGTAATSVSVGALGAWPSSASAGSLAFTVIKQVHQGTNPSATTPPWTFRVSPGPFERFQAVVNGKIAWESPIPVPRGIWVPFGFTVVDDAVSGNGAWSVYLDSQFCASGTGCGTVGDPNAYCKEGIYRGQNQRNDIFVQYANSRNTTTNISSKFTSPDAIPSLGV